MGGVYFFAPPADHAGKRHSRIETDSQAKQFAIISEEKNAAESSPLKNTGEATVTAPLKQSADADGNSFDERAGPQLSMDDRILKGFRGNQLGFIEAMEKLLSEQQKDDLWSSSAATEIENTVADDAVLSSEISISRIECKRTLCIIETPSVRHPRHLHELARRLHQGDFLITAPWVRYPDEGVDKMVFFRKDFVFE